MPQRPGISSARPSGASRAGPETAARAVAVLVVDDQPVFRRAVRELIAATEGFALAGEAASGEEGVERAVELQPDLVLLDVRMPGMDGIEAARRMAAQAPEPVVLLISLEDACDLPAEIGAVGAAAHVRKQDLSPQALRDLWRAHGHAG